jgi:Ca-activated chloride channel homolog
MDFDAFHFAYPLVLWGLTIIPLVILLYAFLYRRNRAKKKLEGFVDQHLLKYLLVNPTGKVASVWKTLLVWTIVWSCIVLSLAGPRWSFREVETFSSDQSLVILLDLSQSMDAEDVKPSRLIRARQKIEDILNHAKGLKIGLIAFAADTHMITPLTQDVETIRYLLPSLDTGLVFMQGSKLQPALQMAENILKGDPGDNQSILVISDGGFDDARAFKKARELADKGIVLYTMGVGTEEGAPIRDQEGNLIKKSGEVILTKLNRTKLQELSQIGRGRYLESNFSSNAEAVIVKDLDSRAEALKDVHRTTRFWDERFYLLIIPLLPILLFWLRRGYIIPLLLMMLIPSLGVEATFIDQYFMNSEQFGNQLLEEGDYQTASDYFQDPYRKGVAHYRAGNFEEATRSFRESNRPEVAQEAAYNTATALVHQQKLQEAVQAYEEVLETWPDHQKAKDNLEVVRKMLESQEQENEDSDKSNDDGENSDNDDSGSENKENDNKEDSGDSDQENQKEQPEDSESDQQDSEQQEPPNENEQENPADELNQDSQQEENEEDQGQEQNADPKEEEQSPSPLTEQSMEDEDADQWLNRMNQDLNQFLKNKFYIESMRNGTKESVDPW